MMRKLLCIIPLLFLGIQPYTQTNDVKNEKEEKFVSKIEEDTLVLATYSEKLIEESVELQKLEQKESSLRKELNRIENKRKQKIKERRELQETKKLFKNFDERGI